MLYNDMKYKNYVDLLYTSFASTIALHKQIPEKIECFENQRNSTTFLVFKRGLHGYLTTKKLVVKTEDAPLLEEWLRSDFPKVKIIRDKNKNLYDFPER